MTLSVHEILKLTWVSLARGYASTSSGCSGCKEWSRRTPLPPAAAQRPDSSTTETAHKMPSFLDYVVHRPWFKLYSSTSKVQSWWFDLSFQCLQNPCIGPRIGLFEGHAADCHTLEDMLVHSVEWRLLVCNYCSKDCYAVVPTTWYSASWMFWSFYAKLSFNWQWPLYQPSLQLTGHG